MAMRARADVVDSVRARSKEPPMLACRIAEIVRHAPIAILALLAVAIVTGDPSTAASGGGDFPHRLR
jgi:hypothetical protein